MKTANAVAIILLIILGRENDAAKGNEPQETGVYQAINQYWDPCPAEMYCTKGTGRGERELRDLGCKVYPIMENYFDEESSSIKRFAMIDLAVKWAGGCGCKQSGLLLEGMQDTSLEISVYASRSYAFNKCPDVLKVLRNQIHSENLHHRLAAVYGLELIGKDAVPVLVEGFAEPDDSVSAYLRELELGILQTTSASHPYLIGPTPTVGEMDVWVKKYKSTFQGWVQKTINEITGETMDKDTTRIQAWIEKQKADSVVKSRNKPKKSQKSTK